jgi:hypothetical protein
VYPVCYPIAGWVAGYFCLRNFQQGALVCIPLVLLLTVFSETAMAIQLWLPTLWYDPHKPAAVQNLTQIAVPAAAQTAMALQVWLPKLWGETPRPDVFHHLVQIAVPEGIVNAILSPFVFYPMRAWYEFTNAREQAAHP